MNRIALALAVAAISASAAAAQSKQQPSWNDMLKPYEAKTNPAVPVAPANPGYDRAIPLDPYERWLDEAQIELEHLRGVVRECFLRRLDLFLAYAKVAAGEAPASRLREARDHVETIATSCLAAKSDIDRIGIEIDQYGRR